MKKKIIIAVTVLGKCANPSCDVPFRYFRHGKLFRFDFHAPIGQIRGKHNGAWHRKVEDYWLCGSCATRMTLFQKDGGAVGTQPLPRSVAKLRETVNDVARCQERT